MVMRGRGGGGERERERERVKNNKVKNGKRT